MGEGGSVIVTYNIMPKSVEVDIDKLEATLKKRFKPQRMKRVPIAFGINAIHMSKIIEEKEGLADKIAEEIEALDNVSTVEIIEMNRSL